MPNDKVFSESRRNYRLARGIKCYRIGSSVEA